MSFSDKKLSEVIDSMRFPLIYLVVIAHMVGFDTPHVRLSLDPKDIYVYISEMFSHNLSKISVRAYFFISGYYLFRKIFEWSQLANYGKLLSAKIRTLFIPYVFWNLILVVAIVGKYYLLQCLFVDNQNSINEYAHFKESTWYSILWEGPANFPLWYMRDLMVLTLLAPLFLLFFRFFKVWGLLILIPVYVYNNFSPITGITVEGILFFGLGGYFAVNKLDVLEIFGKYKIISYVLALLLLIISTTFNGTAYHGYLLRIFILVGLIATINLFYDLNGNEKLKSNLKKLAPYTFFIYVAHEVYLINILKGVWIRVSEMTNEWVKIIGYFVTPLLCILACIIVFEIIKWISPRTLAIITGGREKPFVYKAKKIES